MNQLNKLSGIAHWLPRLALAAIFIYHGFPKIAMTGAVSDMMGMPGVMVFKLDLLRLEALYCSCGGIWPGLGN